MKIFDLDSPLMNVLNKMADLMWLNILTLICCIPIITAGAALTSMHYVALKIVRNEESYITRNFFKSFKTNFRQATVIWLLLLLGLVVWMTLEFRKADRLAALSQIPYIAWLCFAAVLNDRVMRM